MLTKMCDYPFERAGKKETGETRQARAVRNQEKNDRI